MKTNSTVARRRVKRRQDRVSHKKLRTLRSRKYARKTARKIGGAFGSAGYGSTYTDDGWEDDNNSSNNNDKGKDGFGALLYDKIPLSTSRNVPYHLPICVFFISDQFMFKDHVYIFFNKNVTADEITLIVKHYLGIESDDFSIQPPITVSNASVHDVKEQYLWGFLGNTFVKLSGCETFNNNYCLETGVFQPNIALFDVVTTKHKMTSMGKAVEIKTRSRGEIEKLFRGDGGFTKKIPQMSTTIQPDLFKIYIEGLKSMNRLHWDDYDINRQKTQKKQNGEKYRVYGEDRQLEVTYSGMKYLDKHTPKTIVMLIQRGLQILSWFSIPDDIRLERVRDSNNMSVESFK